MAKKKLTLEKLEKILLNYSYDSGDGCCDLRLIIEILVDLNLLDHEQVEYPGAKGAGDGEA